MEPQHQSSAHDAPEAIPEQPRTTFGFVGSDDYEYYEPPPSAFERQRSPVPEYQPYAHQQVSPRLSSQSPPPLSSDITRSPQFSDAGYIKSRPLSPSIQNSIQYSETHSPAPETAYSQQEKEAVYIPTRQAKVPVYQVHSVPEEYHQNPEKKPQVWTDNEHEAPHEERKKKPFYKRWLFILIVIALIVIIAVGVALGVVFGTRKSGSHNSSDASNPDSTSGSGTSNGNNPGVDINTSVGGYINNDYYSKSGAWNGSGIAIAAANSDYDQAIYAFYQDHNGDLQSTLMDPQGRWNLVGPINDNSHKALNGTPLSTVQHQLGAELVWHVFYVDEDYILRERIMTNTSNIGPTGVWNDGPLNDLDLKVWESNHVGFQACYHGNYYGTYSYDTAQATAGIYLWYASDSTVFQQYSWTNGTATWTHDRQFNDLSGTGGVGCQTWDTGMTEYVWFVDTKGDLEMYWQDNNRSANGTDSHPIGEWTKVPIGVHNVQESSSLGYTNYMIWQSDDTTIRGANITWGAEYTKIAEGNGEGGLDTWTLQYDSEDIHAIRGTHLSITAVRTVSQGALLLTFFQEEGDDMQMYTRDAFNSGALWQQAAQDPVVPDDSD